MFLFRNPAELFVFETFVKKIQSKHLRINSDIECGRVHVRNTIRVVEYLCVRYEGLRGVIRNRDKFHGVMARNRQKVDEAFHI